MKTTTTLTKKPLLANTKKCAQCGGIFSPVRKNQLYCSLDCKTDKNNFLLKERYKASAKNNSQGEKLKKELDKLREEVDFLKSLPLVIPTEVKDNSITYQGQKYIKKRVELPKPVTRPPDGYGVLYSKLGVIVRKNPTLIILETYVLGVI